MEHYRIAAAAVTGLLGVCFLVGFFKAFLERIYLGLLGLSFITLATSFLISSPALAWLKITLLALTGLLFIGAIFFAVMQTMAQMRMIQEYRKGLEQEMWEYLEQLKRRAAEQQGEPSGQPAAPGESVAPAEPESSETTGDDKPASA